VIEAPSQDDASAATARVVKRSIVIAGHRTSVSLEDAFWRGLKLIAAETGLSLARIITQIDAARGEANLSSAIRVFVLERLTRARQSP
jgi:predicted DNA-binding ribbon-helix-helix protein